MRVLHLADEAPSVEVSNPFAVLEEEPLEDPELHWWEETSKVVKFRAVMQEMTMWHKRRWGKRALEPPEDDDTMEFTDSASALKRYLMIEWHERGSRLCRAGDSAWSKAPALWNRISLQRLRFQGVRRWYLVARTADRQRRVMVLAVPSRGKTQEERELHAQRQCTYMDNIDNLYEPGLRVLPGLVQHLQGEEKKRGIIKGFPVKHRYHPPRYLGRNYGGALEMPERTEAQMAKERGRFQEGPLHYVPHQVQPMSGIFYPEKDKFRLIFDARKSGYNDSIAEAGGNFDPLEEALRWQTPGCWQFGFDLRDAFRAWPRDQVDCDCMGLYSDASQSYDRVRYAVCVLWSARQPRCHTLSRKSPTEGNVF